MAARIDIAHNSNNCNQMAKQNSNTKHKKMVGFRRSISFSFSTRIMPSLSPSCRRGAADFSSRELSFRVRSISLPARLHPLAAHLDAELVALRSWITAAHSPSEGLAHLQLLLFALSDVLELPQAQDQLRCRGARSSALADRLLDDFLRLTDAHGSFVYSVLDLKHQLAATHVALRRKLDDSCLRSQRQAEKEILKLAAMAQDVGAPFLGTLSFSAVEEEEELLELAKLMRDVITVTASALATVYTRIVDMSSATTAMESMAQGKCGWVVAVRKWRERAGLRQLKSKESVMVGEDKEREVGEAAWREGALDRLEVMEDCIAELQSSSEQVYKGLVNIRISILNILTPSF